MATLALKFSSMENRAAPIPRANILKRQRPLRGRTGLTRCERFSVQQSEAAIAAGAFHNDVVAVANERVLFHP